MMHRGSSVQQHTTSSSREGLPEVAQDPAMSWKSSFSGFPEGIESFLQLAFHYVKHVVEGFCYSAWEC